MRRLLVVITVLAVLAGCSTIRSEPDFDRAVTAFKAGAFADAERFATAADKAKPYTDKVQALIAWSRLMQGNVKGAEQMLRQLRARSPDYIETVQIEGWVALANLKYDLAAERFQAQYDWCTRHLRSDFFPGRYTVKDYNFIQSTFADANYGLALVALARQQRTTAISYLRDAAAIKQYGARKDVEAVLASLQPG